MTSHKQGNPPGVTVRSEGGVAAEGRPVSK